MNCQKIGCTSEATHAIRIELWPHKAVQAMQAQPRPMLTMVMGLYICTEHLPAKVTEVCEPAMLHALEGHATRQHHGILVDRSQTRIVLVELDDPDLLKMQQALANGEAANDSQPGAQQGADDDRQTKRTAD